MDYYVSQNSIKSENGTREYPFHTISKAAAVAEPGDTVWIGEGIYREWVSPDKSGLDDNLRITYRNMPGTKPIISGAELISNWENCGEHLYKASVKRDIFTDYCPFEDVIYGDWYDPCGQTHHTGEIFMDGEALYEAASSDSLTGQTRNSWFARSDGETVTFLVYLPTENPRDHVMEMSARSFGFFPKEEHISYITLDGITVENVATQWAPPTAFQTGAVGPNWSRGWVIENCTIRNSKCVGLSLGKRREETDNQWTRSPQKGGAQTYTEVVFTNLHRDWSREYVGSHTVRHNTIYNCGQAGIVGCMGGIYSTIEDNHIYNINCRGEFGGAEVAGIKLHAGIDVLIAHNCIHDCTMGLWIDWEGQGMRVTKNAFFRNAARDIFIEVCHGPTLIDHNLLLSPTSFSNNSQGTALVHNLISGGVDVWNEPNRFTMYHFPHETAILGSIIIYGGDDKILNNVYLGDGEDDRIGNRAYNAHNDESYIPDTSKNDRPTGALGNSLGCRIHGNHYFGGAVPCSHETDAMIHNETATCTVEMKENQYILSYHLPECLEEQMSSVIDSNQLGTSFESGARYENRDGTDLMLDHDFFDNCSNGQVPAGPFAKGYTHGSIVLATLNE